MTQTADTGTAAAPVEMVNLTIDGVEVSVPKGTLVIRAAELIGVQIPRFCDHPLLDPVGACRQCLVEVEGQRKPMASCTTTVTPDMVVRTQYTSEAADKAQHGVMELLLINHPLDCPVCDKGGECPLQNQAMSNGRAETRFEDVKRTFPKPINISSAGAARPGALRAVRALHPVLRSDRRRPVHRTAGTRCAATGRHRPRRAVPVVLLRQHRADLPGRARSPAPRTGSGPGRSTWCPAPACASTARRDAPSAPTIGAEKCCAAWPVTTRRSTRSGTATRAAGRSPTRPRATASPPR